MAGEKDEIVSFEFQKRTMEAVRKLNGCDGDGKPWQHVGETVGTMYESPTGTPFISLIHPGPHKFPPEIPGLIVKFFREQGK
jgi:polyhydroxybutyrate depolymerase